MIALLIGFGIPLLIVGFAWLIISIIADDAEIGFRIIRGRLDMLFQYLFENFHEHALAGSIFLAGIAMTAAGFGLNYLATEPKPSNQTVVPLENPDRAKH